MTERSTHRGGRPKLPPDDELEWILGGGADLERVADHYGVSKDTVQAARRRNMRRAA